MPILFLILADRLGLDMALAEAPLHMFVRWRDESGGTLNLETTSGAHPARDAWFRHNMPMTDLALANGLYMRSLGRREGVTLMAHTLLESLMVQSRYGDVIEVADVILGHGRRDVYAMLKKATAARTSSARSSRRDTLTRSKSRCRSASATSRWRASIARCLPQPKRWDGKRKTNRP
jgi:hypothetical protein